MVSSLVIFIDSKENSVGQNLVAGSNSIWWFDQIDIYLTFKSELFCQSVYFLFVKRVKHEKLPLPFHSIYIYIYIDTKISFKCEYFDRRASTLQ
jgi:hypothetical protein